MTLTCLAHCKKTGKGRNGNVWVLGLGLSPQGGLVCGVSSPWEPLGPLPTEQPLGQQREDDFPGVT